MQRTLEACAVAPLAGYLVGHPSRYGRELVLDLGDGEDLTIYQ